MWNTRVGRLYTLLLGSALTCRTEAFADETDEKLPVLRSWIPAAYPERALERAIEGDVVLSLSVNEGGTVVGVELLEGAGHGFDAPAQESAWTMVFDPATDKKGDPVPATLTYRYPFRMDDVAPLSLEGVVRVRGDKKVIADALVRAVGPDGQVARTRSDEKGRFRLAALPQGEWVLTVSGKNLFTSSAGVQVPEDGYAEGVVLSAELVPEWMEYDDEIGEYVEVTAERAADPAEREVSQDVVIHLPGSMGDPLRALQNMPSVARAAFGSGQIAVRGADTEDTSYFIDGVEIPIAFHFTAVSTVVSADMLKNIGFYPGGWSTRYGRTLGGVIDLQTNDDLPKRGQTGFSADVFQVAGFTRLRLGQRAALTLSARRSYVDVIAQPVLGSLGAGDLRLPRYYDAQLHFVRTLGEGRVAATMLLSNDTFRLTGEVEDAVTFTTAFQKGILRNVQPLGAGWSVETTLGVGPERQELILSDERTDLSSIVPVDVFGSLPSSGIVSERATPRWSFRHEWVREPGEQILGVRVGFDAIWGRQTLDYSIGQARPEVESRAVGMPSLYAEPTVRLGPVTFYPGVRFEAVDLGPSGTQESPTNPRIDTALDARIRAVGTFGGTRILANFGTYHQPPASRELLAVNGPSLALEQSTQASVGAEQKVLGDARIGVTLFYSWLEDLIVGRDDVFRFDRTTLVPGDRFIPFVNAGIGRAYGAEVFGTWITDQRIVWLALSLSRSLRRDLPDEDWHPGVSDQPVNATLILSQALGKWRVGARTRYVTGPPLTPVISTVYVADLQTWAPLYGEPFSQRAPAFFSLDVRVDREWWYEKWRLALYAEVQNATNHRNVEIPGFSEDYSEDQSVTGLPIFPVIGARATW